jgi:hypothetical protein
MTFEDTLRDQLHRHGHQISLQGAGADHVIDRSRRRRRNQRSAGGVAVAAALVAGAVGAASLGDRGDGSLSIRNSGFGFPDAEPLDLSWSTVAGGVTNAMIVADDAELGTYALSTAPGARWSEDVPTVPRALYRLADDGTWEPILLGEAGRPVATDVAASGGLLYAISTSAVPGGAGYAPVISASADRGSSWQPTELAAVQPPNDLVEWDAGSALSIESTGDVTVAVVSTYFTPVIEEYQEQMEAGGDGSSLGIEYREEGLALVEYDLDDVPAVPASGGKPERVEPTVLDVTPWAELGIDGADDLGPDVQVYVLEAGSWAPVDAGLGGMGVGDLDVVGDEIALQVWDDAAATDGRPAPMRVVATSDGHHWREVGGLTDQGMLLGLGSTWIDVPWFSETGPSVRASLDGSTWETIDLATVDERLGGSQYVAWADSGPLGLAVITTDDHNQGYLATTLDLVTWTVVPLEELFGRDDLRQSNVIVGSDHIVVTGVFADEVADGEVAESVTAVGTPER